MAMGCGRSVDERLVLADSLMWTAPDSSLAILNAIDRDSLGDDENLAYHALLLTQAQFRVDYAIPYDSLIKYAIDCYDDNRIREHYARALLYKGAYYEVHDNPVEAIKWYKRAEDNADTTDYRNLAQINLRMGMLYYKNYASNNLDLEKIKRALYYYRSLNDKPMTMFCLGIFGNLCRESRKKEAIKSLRLAKKMAIELNDTTSYYYYLNELSMAFFLDSLYVKAKDAAMECINNIHPSNAMLFNAANAYATLNMPDSARYYINMVPSADLSDYDRMMITYSRAYIARAEGNENEALRQENYATAISDMIKAKSKRNTILEAESMMDTELKIKKNKHLANIKYTIAVVFIFIGVILLLVIANIIHKRNRYNLLIRELKDNQLFIQEIIDENRSANERLAREKETNDFIKQQYNIQSRNSDFLNQYFSSLNALLNKCYDFKRVDFINEFVNIIKQASNDDIYWEIIFDVANKKTNGWICELKNEVQILSPIEIKILSLISLGYTNDAIAASTGYEKNSIKTIKTRIKNKINADMNLDAFVKHEILKRNHFKQ